MIRLAVFAFILSFAFGTPSTVWHKNAVVYQIYPRSFKDTTGDGIGDLNGITSKLQHVVDIGANAIWLSPIYKSPQVDFGYDIANFTEVDLDYGTMADFDRLVAKARSLGLKVILDFVPNHSSTEHPWFKKSVLGIKPYDEYYVWRDAKIVNGTRQPPNNWLSTFQGSAWEWNNIRKQYYLHQFATGQPDLNYRSQALNQEMKNVLTFWLNHGVEGFRIDAINHMFEDAKFLDEPRTGSSSIPADDYDSLYHVYTKDQKETFEVLKSWRKLLDDYSNRTKSDAKIILTEAYTHINQLPKYHEAGSDVPFNFMFMTELTNKSTNGDFLSWILKGLNMPGRNWVVGNHDNHRAATRFGRKRADQITMLSMMLPGIAVVYNGDEIGMEDRNFTFLDTRDPAGCNAGPSRYFLKSRDPERTPYQWDNTTSAGFSDRRFTWLPVHDNFRTLNLAAQKSASFSHYKVFKALVALKKKPVLAEGVTQLELFPNGVLGVTRNIGSTVAVLLINFSDSPVTVDARYKLNLPDSLMVYTASVGSNLVPGTRVISTNLKVPAAASVVYTNPALVFQRETY